MNSLGLKCRGLLCWGGGIHTLSPPTGQWEAGSLHRVAADQAADPWHLTGDRLELWWQQPPALSWREKEPQQGEDASARVVSLLSVGPGTGRTDSILVSWGVLSGFWHQKKHVLFCNGNAEDVFLIIYTPFLSCLRSVERRRRWRAAVGQGLTCMPSWPWARTWPAVWASTQQRAPSKIRGLSEGSPSGAKSSGKKLSYAGLRFP